MIVNHTRKPQKFRLEIAGAQSTCSAKIYHDSRAARIESVDIADGSLILSLDPLSALMVEIN